MHELAGVIEAQCEVVVDYKATTLPILYAGATGAVMINGRKPLAAEPYLRLLQEELSRYPKGLFRKIGLGTIIVGSEVAVGGVELGGAAVFGAGMSGGADMLPPHLRDPRENVLVLSVDVLEVPEYARHVIHHEIWHVLEFMGTGRIEWEEPRRERGAAGTYSEKSRPMEQGRPYGCVSSYANSDDAEDRAEMFAYMMTQPKELARLGEQDQVVMRKWKRLSAWLSIGFPELRHPSSPSQGR